MMISLIDATSSSLTVSWPETPGACRYVLQYRKGNHHNAEEVTENDDDAFQTLSSKLSTTQARKRNLDDANRTGFTFRVGAVLDTDSEDVTSWISHSEPYYLLSPEEEDSRMAAPKVSPAGNKALLVSWESVANNSSGYELQMRKNEGGAWWTTISSSLSRTEVRKKNLTCKSGYQFRLRPNTHQEMPFSSPSEAAAALGLSAGIERLFSGLENGNLIKNPNRSTVKLEEALGGKEFVLLYASAHWCGPCRQFTPMLANWYKSVVAKTYTEVVFLSCDHDERGFQSYFASMPWVAVPFDDDARESLLAHIRVTGIPRLVVLDGKTGRIVEDNTVGKPLDIARWRQLAAVESK